jgi:hypothetical protein
MRRERREIIGLMSCFCGRIEQMPNPPFKPFIRFAARASRWACILCLAVFAILAVSACIAAFARVEHWEYFLYASGISLGAALKLARGGDPSGYLPSLPKSHR